MDRRQFLAGCGTALAAGFAGCAVGSQGREGVVLTHVEPGAAVGQAPRVALQHLHVGQQNVGQQHGLGVLESRAWQISEAFVKKEGSWSGSPMVASSMGVEEDWPVLSLEKLSDLNQVCNSYPEKWKEYQRLLDVDTLYHGTGINVTNLDTGVTVASCGKTEPGIQHARSTRFAMLDNGDVLRINVWYW